MEKEIKLIEPQEGENTHIESHKELNRYVTQFYSRLNNIEDKVDEIGCSISDIDGDCSSSFSEINKIKKDIKKINETLGCMAEEIKNLKEKVNSGRKYLSVNYEGILDTDSVGMATLDTIELDGEYLVHIIENEVTKNQEVSCYFLGCTAIANNEYTPQVRLTSKGGHAVLEYNFTVILIKL